MPPTEEKELNNDEEALAQMQSLSLIDFSEEQQLEVRFVVYCAYSMNVGEVELYYHRILLNHASGATFYKDMQTLSAERCASFRKS